MTHPLTAFRSFCWPRAAARWMLALAALGLAVVGAAQQAPTTPLARRPTFEIQPIAGDLYRSGNGAWHSLFLVTPDGILLVDPLNMAHAAWLKEELAQRFALPVKYVVYSHSHWDHVEGAALFGDTARVVAHEGVLRNMDGRYPNMPGDMIDRNGNGNVDREDIMVPTTADPGICGMFDGFFEQMDRDHDGSATPAEFQQNIVKPDLTYRDTLTLTLGGRTVQLLHPGRNHGDDMTVLYFPAERVVFAADMIADALVRANIRSLPSACGPYDGHPIDEWIASYEAVLALDFDIFAGGHGAFFSKTDVALPLRFLQDLRREVQDGLDAGKTLAELKQQLQLEPYRDWAYYDKLREKNIEAMYRNLTELK